MSPFYRAVLLALLLLAAFLGLAFGVLTWLGRETIRVRQAAVAARADALADALALVPRAPEQWDETYRARLGQLVGGFVTVGRAAAPGSPTPSRMEQSFRVQQPLPGHPGWIVRADLKLPGLDRLQLMHQRALVVIVLIGGLLVLVPLALALLGGRRGDLTRPPWAQVRAEAAGLEHFARVSVERGDALVRELDARRRAEENLQISRTQLDHSLAERIRLGRELHDNISQTLYAVSLTLESVRRKLDGGSPAVQRLDQCMAELKRLNQEVRAFLRELEPDGVQRETFASALGAMLDGLAVGDGVRVERRIDDQVAALIPTPATADVLNILREAISNSVRHGGAKQVTLRAERSDDTVAIAVVDDGTGFDSAHQRDGHGLANMQARAAALGGDVKVTSQPGKGTRVLLTLPVPSAP